MNVNLIPRPPITKVKVAALIAGSAAVVMSGVLVGQASYSAFSDSTTNPISTWATGNVELGDDARRTAAFAASDLMPGDSGSRCIVVTSTGSLASTVKLYTTDALTTNNLASHINLTITQGAGGSFGTCAGYSAESTVFSGTLAGLGSTATGFSSGLGSWDATGDASESRSYQITYGVSDNAPNSTQGGTAALGFTFEARSS